MVKMDLPAMAFRLTQVLSLKKKQKHVHRREQPQVVARYLKGSNKRPAVGVKLGGGNVELGLEFPLESGEREPEFDLLEESCVDEAEGPVGAYFVIKAHWQSGGARQHHHPLVVLLVKRLIGLVTLCQPQNCSRSVHRRGLL